MGLERFRSEALYEHIKVDADSFMSLGSDVKLESES